MFDIKTLMIVGAFIPFSFLALLLYEFKWSKKQAVRYNLAANLFYLLSIMLFLLKNRLPTLFTYILSYYFQILSATFVLMTTFRLFKIKDLKKRAFIVNVLILATLLIFHYLIPNEFIHYSIVYIGLFALYLYGVFRIIFNSKRKNKELISVFIIEFIYIAVSSLIRFIQYKHDYDLSNPILPSTHYVLASFLFMLFWNYTIQLKRNAIFRYKLERNSEEIYQIQEDLSFLNNTYIESCTDCPLEDIYPHIFGMISGHFRIKYAILFLYDKSLKPKYSIGFNNKEVDIITYADKESNINNIAFSNMYPKEIYVGNLEDNHLKNILLERALLGGIAFPLFADTKRLGTLFIGVSSDSTIIHRDRDIFSSICRQISGVIYSAQLHNELIESREKLIKMASTDHLTGIYNRREFFKLFRNEFDSSIRHGDMFSLFMIDIDDFKLINDQYGHDVGDSVLVKVTHFIRSSLRTSDIFARYGGEEFVGVLLRCDVDGAINKLNKIINNVNKIRIHKYQDLNISISVGLCVYDSGYENVESMIKKADIELYKAKKRGKNQLSSDKGS